MTREEIERARELLEIHRRTSHMSCTVERGELVGLVMNHVEELLSLAEEARWRSVAEEPPPFDSLILIAHPRPTGYLGRDGKWVAHGKFLDSHDYPKHWRPLPKGPER